MITKIAAYAPDEWSFIEQMLEKEAIENTEKEYEEKDTDTFSQFGLEKEIVQEPWEGCRDILMRKATQEMWRRTSKDQVNTLLKAMYNMKVLSVKMPNGGDYTPDQLIEEWMHANEK